MHSLAQAASSSVRPVLPFELFLRQLWPRHATKEYMRVTGLGERAAKYRITGERPPSYAEVVAMLHSRHGWEFLSRVMEGSRATWWRDLQRARAIGALRRELAAQSRRIAQMELALDDETDSAG